MEICKKDIAATEEGRLNYGLSKSAREKVFLIGDSIREGYCPYVEEFLDGTFQVAYPNENCRNTQYVWVANPRTNEEIERYNQLAIKAAKEEGVCVGDMYEVVSRFGEECYKDYAHLKDEYCKRLGAYVASVIKSCIQ